MPKKVKARLKAPNRHHRQGLQVDVCRATSQRDKPCPGSPVEFSRPFLCEHPLQRHESKMRPDMSPKVLKTTEPRLSRSCRHP